MLLTILTLTIGAAVVFGLVVIFVEGFNAVIRWREKRKARKRAAREAMFTPCYSDEDLVKPPVTAVN